MKDIWDFFYYFWDLFCKSEIILNGRVKKWRRKYNKGLLWGGSSRVLGWAPQCTGIRPLGGSAAWIPLGKPHMLCCCPDFPKELWFTSEWSMELVLLWFNFYVDKGDQEDSPLHVVGAGKFRHREDFAAGHKSSGHLGQNQRVSGLVGGWCGYSLIK